MQTEKAGFADGNDLGAMPGHGVLLFKCGHGEEDLADVMEALALGSGGGIAKALSYD